MTPMIGYSAVSPNVMDPKALRDWYADLKISDSYFQKKLEAHKFNFKMKWTVLFKPVDPNRWDNTMPTADGNYDPLRNQIFFPAGRMQMPLFAYGLPEYASYGGFGSLAGHEVTHGFDNNGAKYDETGRLRDWWDNATWTSFNLRAQCFVDQYAKFTVPGLGPNQTIHVKGKQTLGENIADAGGLSTSFAAWQKRSKSNPNPGLPGLEHFTNEQLFFLAYSNTWCGKFAQKGRSNTSRLITIVR